MVTASIIESLYVHCNGRFYDFMSSMQELFRAAMSLPYHLGTYFLSIVEGRSTCHVQ